MLPQNVELPVTKYRRKMYGYRREWFKQKIPILEVEEIESRKMLLPRQEV